MDYMIKKTLIQNIWLITATIAKSEVFILIQNAKELVLW